MQKLESLVALARLALDLFGTLRALWDSFRMGVVKIFNQGEWDEKISFTSGLYDDVER